MSNNRNWPPPPPRQQQQQPKQPNLGTIDSLFNNKENDSMKNSSLNDIDDDDDGDESTEISDNDSVLAMAKRLDAASVISDPFFIEGADPHMRGVDPGGLGGGRGNGNGNNGNGQHGNGGLYGRDHRDLDSIASESESDSESSSDSDSSFERNPHRGNNRPRHMGQPHVGFHGGNNNNRSSNNNQYRPPAGRGHAASYQQQQQDHHRGYSINNNINQGGVGYNEPELNPNRGGGGGHGHIQHAPELNPNRGRQGYNNGLHGGREGPAELNSNNNGKNVRFTERGQRRVYREYEGEKGIGPPPINSSGASSSRQSDDRNHGRSGSPSGRSRDSRGSKSTENKKGNNAMSSMEKEERKRRIKLIAIPIVVLLLIGLAVGVAVAVTKGGDSNDDNDNNNNANDKQTIQIPLPTASPSFVGNCPYGKAGPVPTDGCLGYVACNAFGEVMGNVIWCPEGTLYDLEMDVCNHVKDVECDSELPSSDDWVKTDDDESSDIIVVENTDRPTLRPTRLPTPRPTAMASFAVVEPEEEDGTELRGPTTDYGLELLFSGVSNPGDMTSFELSLENYLRMFYSPANLASLDDDDALKSVTDVVIDLTLTGLERRRGRLLGGKGENGNAIVRYETKANVRRRRMQFTLLGPKQEEETTPQFILIYDQTTTYRTSDPSVTRTMILSRPFDPLYSDVLVSHLKTRDPATFGDLTKIVYLDGDEDGEEPMISSGDSTNIAMTTKPTNAPSKERTNYPTRPPTLRPVVPPAETYKPTPFAPELLTPFAPEVTDDPTKRPTKQPTPFPTTAKPTPFPTTAKPVIEFPVVITVQGLLWLDENENGLYETSETPMEGLFVNLRSCYKDTWKGTKTTNAKGMYQFIGVEEGGYYIDFFKPNPRERYGFTIPKIGGDDDTVMDSDVVTLDGENAGKSECFQVSQGFTKLTNAGYLLKDLPAPTPPPTLGPTPLPTQNPTLRPTTPNPTEQPMTSAPTIPRFCAVVTEIFGGAKTFDFQECNFPCESPLRHDDCPDGMLCALTHDCS